MSGSAVARFAARTQCQVTEPSWTSPCCALIAGPRQSSQSFRQNATYSSISVQRCTAHAWDQGGTCGLGTCVMFDSRTGCLGPFLAPSSVQLKISTTQQCGTQAGPCRWRWSHICALLGAFWIFLGWWAVPAGPTRCHVSTTSGCPSCQHSTTMRVSMMELRLADTA